MTLREMLEKREASLRDIAHSLPASSPFLRDQLKVEANLLGDLAARFPEAEKPVEPAPAPAPLDSVLAPQGATDPDAVAGATHFLRHLSRYLISDHPSHADLAGRWADRLAESVPGGAEEGRTAAYAEGWHDGRKALLDHEGIALSGAAASGAASSYRRGERKGSLTIQVHNGPELWLHGEELTTEEARDFLADSGLNRPMRHAPPAPATSAARFEEGVIIRAGNVAFWMGTDAWTAIPDSERRDYLAGLLRSRNAGGPRTPVDVYSSQRPVWRVVGEVGPSPRRCLACNLLNPGSDHCPATESGKHVMEAEDERGDDPQAAKVKELILYIIQGLQDSPEGATIEKMRHVLFQADMRAYRDLGQSLTGGTWYKTESGPELRLDSGQVAFGPDDPAIDACPDVEDLREALRLIAREELAKLERGGDGVAPFFSTSAERAIRKIAGEEIAATLARLISPTPRPEPPEEHVAPDTSSTRRKP